MKRYEREWEHGYKVNPVLAVEKMKTARQVWRIGWDAGTGTVFRVKVGARCGVLVVKPEA